MKRNEKLLLLGAVGQIETLVDYPDTDDYPNPIGLAWVAHPHPLFGGTMFNKVVETITRALLSKGYVVARCNFRGVGQTQGEHSGGEGEIADMVSVVEQTLVHWKTLFAIDNLPKVLAGFSFGAYVQTHVREILEGKGITLQKMILVGTATSRWQVANVPEGTLVIHGELDETVPLISTLDWARPQNLPVVVVPGADHFFHGRLPVIKQLVIQALI